MIKPYDMLWFWAHGIIVGFGIAFIVLYFMFKSYTTNYITQVNKGEVCNMQDYQTI